MRLGGAGIVCAAALAATAIAVAASRSEAAVEPTYDGSGFWAGPVLCPLRVPGTPGWAATWSGFTYRVQKFALPEADGVPFFVTSLTLTPNIQPVTVGQGWYRPSPTTTTYEGASWAWEAMSGEPGVLYSCREEHYFFGSIRVSFFTFTGQVWGHAFSSAFPGGNATRQKPGRSEGGEICYEYYEWWYDQYGVYHETILDTWCVPEYET